MELPDDYVDRRPHRSLVVIRHVFRYVDLPSRVTSITDGESGLDGCIRFSVSPTSPYPL